MLRKRALAWLDCNWCASKVKNCTVLPPNCLTNKQSIEKETVRRLDTSEKIVPCRTIDLGHDEQQ